MGLAKRIIPSILNKNGHLIKGKVFAGDRVIGHSLQASRIFAMRGVDELLLLDISATPEKREPDYKMVEALSSKCFTPLTVGGGVCSALHIRGLLNAGADKVCIGTAAMESPRFIEYAALHFGSQAIVVSIDVKGGRVWTNCGKVPTPIEPVTWAKTVERMGAGEILLSSIDRDGEMCGYDLEVIQAVCASVDIPVIASGGAGSYQHMADAIGVGASAVAAGALFAFTNNTPKGAAEYLGRLGVEVRL